MLFSWACSSGSLRLSDLCIASGDSCWVVYADVLCLNFDGNLADACLLALVQSLRRLQIPETEVVEEGFMGGGFGGRGGNEVCVSSSNFRTLASHRTLLPLTFAVIEGHVVADPTLNEEELSSATLTVVIDETGALCQVHKPGGVPLTDEQINACIRTAKARLSVLLPLLK